MLLGNKQAGEYNVLDHPQIRKFSIYGQSAFQFVPLVLLTPDWGILRYDDEGAVVLELVRETKGAEELDQLQFPHEKRKVRTAQKHFRAIDLDYRVITDAMPQWWLPGDELPTQDEFE